MHALDLYRYSSRVAAIAILLAGLTCTPTCVADDAAAINGAGDHYFDLALNSAFVVLRGRTDSYSFINVMPEFRLRFNGINAGSWYIALGSPLISNVNSSNPASSTKTNPSPLFHTNFETSLGFAAKLDWSDAMVVAGVGYMNIQVNQAHATYDKGPFGFIGFSISLMHSSGH